MITATAEQLAAAFAEWDRDYREDPDGFWSTVEHLLQNTPETYGDEAAACLAAYLAKQGVTA